MRLWSVHPRQLDRIGLVACWREALLAQAVLAGNTKGYRQHPQLQRFRTTPEPLDAIGAYLSGLVAEADRRGFRFDRTKILSGTAVPPIPVTAGQLAYEWEHLGAKLRLRSPEDAERWSQAAAEPHPLFVVVPGGIEPWERP